MPVDSSDYRRFAAAARAAARELQTSVLRELRDVAQPVARDVLTRGSEPMPARGGLRAYLERAGFDVRPSLSGALIELDGFAGLDRGVLRHPVFEQPRNRSAWVTQRVLAGTYSGALDESAPQVHDRLESVLQGVLANLTRKA